MTEGNNQKDTSNKLSNTNYENPVASGVRWLLVLYDFIFFALAEFLLLIMHPSYDRGLSAGTIALQAAIAFVCIFGARFVMDVYRQVWRYGGIKAYIRLVIADVAGGTLYLILEVLLPIEKITFIRLLSIVCINLLFAITARLIYYYMRLVSGRNTAFGRTLRAFLRIFGGTENNPDDPMPHAADSRKIQVAIVGAGRLGVSLAEDLLGNSKAPYLPICFIDSNKEKIGRRIFGLPIIGEGDNYNDILGNMEIQEVIFAIPDLDHDKRKFLYEMYKKSGYKIKVYDYPSVQSEGIGKRTLREFDAEELLFRKEVELINPETEAFYSGKTVLVTGGGGSIGSELCRQIAKMGPKRLVILDVYENGAYDIQQELRMQYGGTIDTNVEILSVCDRSALENVFAYYKPEIIIHAAAHKHVPLMEHNCCEAIMNNVFGTLNAVELADKYHADKFIMVSTDKAVNPTNVMGATKRFCEMIVMSYGQHSNTCYSLTRFGNVLGSAGSVIPLFKRQIANGGPVTVTDKRIIRYFMTIPEAATLVLQAGAKAKNGELSVLDMGNPVKILDLAENMIRLSGFEPYKDIDIIETGLRPGEKLYEELLTQSSTLTKTENDKIFIETDIPLTEEMMSKKLEILKNAAMVGDNDAAREALKKVVPTYKAPDGVNKSVGK